VASDDKGFIIKRKNSAFFSSNKITCIFYKRKIIKVCKRHFACNGTVVEHSEYGEVIQFQGDQRDNISRFLREVKLARPEQIKIHGF